MLNRTLAVGTAVAALTVLAPPPALAATAPTPIQVVLVQAELRDLGSVVTLTGQMDAATRAALHDQGARTLGQLGRWTQGDDPTVLRRGDAGSAVRDLQVRLNLVRNVWAGPADGMYGPLTASGVRTFQNDAGLPVTGRVDLPTLKALAGGDAALLLQPASRTIQARATAYGPSAQDNYPFGAVDAFGKPLRPGDVAVDPSVIPLGTHLWISGYRSPYLPAGGFEAVARDTGGAIRGDRIDIFMDAGPRAVASFGVQSVAVRILP